MSAPSPTACVGLVLPTREMAMTGDFAVAPLLEFARRAEGGGFDSAWVGDSLTARPRLDPLVVLSAVAGATTSLTLGTAALTAALRPPLLGANMITSLDHVSGGRVELALGAGFPAPESEAEFAAAGVGFRDRVQRLDETVRLWRSIWSGRGSYSGRYWQIEGIDQLPPPVRPGGPRLWLAGSDTPWVLSRAAELYDGWLPFLPNPEAYGAAWQRMSEKAAAAGRGTDAITPGLYATININPNGDHARAELADYVQRYYRRSLDCMSTIQAFHCGTAEECADWLAGYGKRGARHFVLRIGSLQPDAQVDQAARVLLPRLRAQA
jgi:alkanesulfonate monooxygenase SsuD/methylene tetrahydromethanopterin reductase-like flavin-dependent oxidoreductase (luciferase family)